MYGIRERKKIMEGVQRCFFKNSFILLSTKMGKNTTIVPISGQCPEALIGLILSLGSLWDFLRNHDQGCGSGSGVFAWIRIRFSNFLDPDLEPVLAKILENCRKVSKSDRQKMKKATISY